MQQLPENVRDWLYSGELGELESSLKEFVLPSELRDVNALELAVFQHDVTISEFVTKMQEIVPGIRGTELAKGLIGASFLRIKDWFSEDVADELRKLGGDPMKYKELLDGDEAVADALRGVNVELIPPRSREAIFSKMQDYLNGALDKASLLEAMMKSPKIGGWGWDQDIALPVVEGLEKHLLEAEEKHAAFVSKEQFASINAKKTETRKLLEADFQKNNKAIKQESKQASATGQSPAALVTVPVADITPAVIPETQQSYLGSSEVTLDPRVKPEDDTQDPFAFIIAENIPHLADSELNINTSLPDPFEELFAELASARGQSPAALVTVPVASVSTVEKPEYDYAYIHEHRRLADPEDPKTPFERALHASDILLEHELLEIEHRKEDLMKDLPEAAIVVSSTLDALLERIIDESKFDSKDASLVRRVRNIISSRLRDIRGSEETAKLLSKISYGVRELSHEMVEKLVMLTESAFLEFQRKVIERGLQRERSRRVRVREEILEQKREDVFNTEKELNARFKKLTGQDLSIDLPMPTPDEADVAATGAMKEKDALDSTGSRVKPVMTTGGGMTEVKASPAPVRDVSVTLSAKSTAPVAKPANGAPIGDVKYARQLSGPVEELRNMRLTDFRRLSKDPKAATGKVMAKVELLAADGYEKKVQGVMAWRDSPIMKLYMAVTKQALDDATPLTAVLDKKRKEIPEMLTLEECTAIREFNSKLRY